MVECGQFESQFSQKTVVLVFKDHLHDMMDLQQELELAEKDAEKLKSLGIDPQDHSHIMS